MKVLYVNTVCNYGSTGKLCVYLQNYLEKRNVSSVITFGRKFNTAINQENNGYYFSSKFDNYTHALYSFFFDLHGRGSKKNTKKLISFIQKERPDLIHMHNLHGYYLNYPIFFEYLKNTEIPVVWTLHDMWPITGHSAFIDEALISTEKEYYLFDHKKNYPRSISKHFQRNFSLKQKVFGSLDSLTIVTPSKWLQNVIQDTYLKKYESKVIYNGIDLSPFEKNGNIEKYEKKTILGVANIWEERKGLKYFLELAKKIDKDTQIIIVGKISKEVALPLNCVNIERTDNVDELAEIYQRSHVFFNPTLNDNFPTTNIEALASGIPVVTFKTGGSSEVVLNENIGAVIENRDIKSIKKELEKFLNFNSTFEYECRKAAEYFSANRMGESYYQLYERIIQEKNYE